MTKKKSNATATADAPASAERPGSDATEPRRKHAIYSEQPTMTKQSFKGECDVNEIVARFLRTGEVEVTNQLKPQYGDAPDQTFFESSCIAAEAASQLELDPTLGRTQAPVEIVEPEPAQELSEPANAEKTEETEELMPLPINEGA